MPRKVTPEIHQFCDYIAEQITAISKIDNRLFQKILYASLLDTMGRAKFPDGFNHDRIVQFIDDCSSWEDRNRVSVVQLKLLGTDKIQSQSPLAALITERIAALEHGTLPRPNADPFISEIEVICPEESKLVKQGRYAELFFHYRHTLIHEFREPGYPMEVSADGSTPYYFYCLTYESLYYP